jgi:ribosomal protein S24E
MDMKIIKQEKSALPRHDVHAFVAFEETTPSRHSIRQSLAKKMKADEKLVIIRHIYNNYGTNESVIYAYIYDNEEALNAIEYAKMIAKNNKQAVSKEAGSEA